MSGPLANVRVLDLSRIMAGPWASQILADLGADVIKVERPGVGDDTRRWGPPYLEDRDGAVTGESGYFLCVNRGKRSVTVDLNSAEGQALIRALAARSDVVLENYKVGTLAKYGLDYASLAEVNPRLVYASVTGFGQTGPMAEEAAYDFMIQGLGGLMSVTGERDDLPGGGPQKVGVPIVDLMTGMYTAVAVLAALHRRAESGLGDYVDIAMLDVQAAFLANQAMNYLISGAVPARTGNRHPNIQPQDRFAVKDGHIIVAVGNDEQFRRFADALGRADLADDPNFARNEARVRRLKDLYAIIEPILQGEESAVWLARLRAVGVPCGPINKIDAVFREPQVQHRRMLRDLPHPLSGTVPQVVSPMRFQRSPLAFERPPPLLGEHTAEVLRELGFETEKIEALQGAGVV